jgi:phosphoglycerol transferase MdoB-like AlkP superfamily enzyme
MEDKENRLDSLLNSAEEYGKTSLELIKLKTLDKTSEVASTIISRIVPILIFLITFIMGSIGAALWIGEIIGRPSYGFFVITGFYCIIGVVFYFFMHKRFKQLIADFIIKEVLK